MLPLRRQAALPGLWLTLVSGLGLILSATLLQPAWAQSLSLGGRMGERALLVIDGQPQLLRPGESSGGVRLLRWVGERAVLERDGVLLELAVGGATLRATEAAADAGPREIVLPAGPGGHFHAEGAINGRAVRFLVDTGATYVALGRDDAQRLGLSLAGGQPLRMGTANGDVVATRLTLGRVRVGAIELTQVEAVVLPAAMPTLLLGNSFLSRLQMRRDNDVMRLQPR